MAVFLSILCALGVVLVGIALGFLSYKFPYFLCWFCVFLCFLAICFLFYNDFFYDL